MAKKKRKSPKQVRVKRKSIAKQLELLRKRMTRLVKKGAVTRIELIKANESLLQDTKEKLRKRGMTKEVEQWLEQAFVIQREHQMREAGLEETDESNILQRLTQAETDGNFDDVAYELAEYYDWEPQEIYSLWYGYEKD